MQRGVIPIILLGACVQADEVSVAQDKQVFPGWITGCSAGPFGSENCPAARAGEVMANMPIGMLERDLPSATFETFALEDAMRRSGAAVQRKATTGSCAGMTEVMQAAETMRVKVPANPGLSGNEAALFNHLTNIVENAGTYVGEGC
ncbi:hypothetical protein [Yoonia sp. 2307UL14-13]|uniref:hypothetical protein n=1 Tax=Yoonia sp. 2307UL14-13 TaxID=3126506 RepID=UPI0030B38FC3